jgi:DNA-binding ferritin-like protein (Dps family)
MKEGMMMKKDMRSFNKVLVVFFMILFVSFGIYSISTRSINDGQAIEKNKILSDNSSKKPDSNIVDNSDVKEIDNIDNNRTKTVISNDVSTIIDKLIVFQEEAYNETEANKMISRLEKIPYPILEKLVEEDIEIILSNTNITDVKEYKHLKGVTPKGWEDTGRTWDDVPGAGGKPVVARIGYSEPSEAHGAINLELHETAHAIDAYVFVDISTTKEFKDIWKQEVNSVFGDNPYFVNYPEEYFAETFAMYYLNDNEKEVLKGKAPLTYNFITNLEYEIGE